MNLKQRTILLALLVLGGCGVQAGNPGAPVPGKYRLSGIITSVEDGAGLQRQVKLTTRGSLVKATTSGADGYYELSNVDDGQYQLQVDEYRKNVRISGDTVEDIGLPVPAVPSDIRVVEIGLWEGFCLLWTDNSGLEAGFRVIGPQSFKVPSDRAGVVDRAEELKHYDRGRGWPSLVDTWNDLYAGTYFVMAYNEYGDSASTAVQAFAYDYSAPWKRNVPVENGDYKMCLSGEPSPDEDWFESEYPYYPEP